MSKLNRLGLTTWLLCIFMFIAGSASGSKLVNFDFTFVVTNCNEVSFTITQGTPVATQWDFGDGDVSILQNPTHFYGLTGSYTVCLTASDATGTYQICKTVDILATDCCAGLSFTTAEYDDCCFSLEIDNPVDQFFTGVRLTLSGPTQLIPGFQINGPWGITGPPTATSVEFGISGIPHIPTGLNPVVNFCLDQATTGSETITIEWLVGPNVVCSTTEPIDCELCIPAANTFSAAYEAKQQPGVDYGYDEEGYDLIVDKNTDEIVVLGGTEFLGEIGTNGNLLFKELDECGNYQSPTQLSGPTTTSTYQISSAHMVDISDQQLACDPVTNNYVAFINTDRGGFDRTAGFVLMDENGCTTFYFELPSGPANTQTTINEVIRVGSDTWLAVGTRRYNLPPPYTEEAFINKITLGPDPCSPTGTALSTSEIFTFNVNTSNRTTGEAIVYDPNTNLIYIGGYTMFPAFGGAPQTYIASLDLNINSITTVVLDADNNADSEETVSKLFIDSSGDLLAAGNVFTGGGIALQDRQLWLAKFSLPLSINCSNLIWNYKYDIELGMELVTDALQDANGDYILAGDALVPDLITPGQVGSEHPFLMKLNTSGEVLWTKTYEQANHLEAIDLTQNGFAMVGRKDKLGEIVNNPPFPPTQSITSDVWVAKTNSKGELADCDCFTDRETTLILPVEALDCPGAVVGDILDPFEFLVFDCVVADSSQTKCFPNCGPGGPGNPCPSGCCAYLSGYKFEDTNCDGVKDPFEPNLCGWTIELRELATNNLVASTVTNSAGFYAFTNVCPGDYIITEVQQNCWTQTYPAAGIYQIQVTPHSLYFDQDFGNCLDLDCTMDIAAGIINLSQSPICENELRINNSLCLGLDRVCIETNNGVLFGSYSPAPGFQLSALYPPTSTRICIEAAGGGPITAGNNQHLLNFSLDNICTNQQTPQQILVDYYLDLPCSFDKLACSETIFAECPINCPTICDGVEADYSPNAQGPCCFDIQMTNPNVDLFTQVNINAIGVVDMTNSVILNAGQWSYLNNTTSQVSLISNTGNICPTNGFRYLPTGTSTPVSLCLDNFPNPSQQLEVEWLGCDGQVCSDTLTFECATGCVEIVSDTFYCENNIYKYDFDFLNLWDKTINFATISYIDPSGATFSPDTIAITPGVNPLSTGSGSFCLDNLGNATDVKLVIQFLESECCWCFSDTICLEVPECPCNDCEDLVYDPVFVGNDSMCCWELNIENPCLLDMKSIELALLDGVSFQSQSAGPGWFFQNFPSINTARWQPLLPPPGTTPIPTGPINNKIEFCITDFDSPPVIPQVMEVRWIDMQDSVACIDSLFFDCEPVPPDTCLVIVNDTITCLPDGTWQLDWSVVNQSNQTANFVYVNSLYSLPAGAGFAPGIGNNIPVLLPPNNPPVAMPPINISNAAAGDQVCIQASIYDNAFIPPFGNWCCHGDTICFTLPPCPIDTASAGCCDSLWIYGDEFENKPDRIKHFNGFTYLASNKVVAGDMFAVFSKFDGNGNLQWEHQFDGFSQILDFVETPVGEFLLIGRTTPVNSGGWQNNRSILASLDAAGNENFINEYDNNGRETFLRIVEHPAPLNPACPYYILGIENQDNTQNSATDEAHLYNLDAAGNICFSVEYTYMNDNGSDDQWVRLLPLQNGNLIISGDRGVTRRGVISEVSGLNGSIVNTLESDLQLRFWDGVQINAGLAAFSGAYFNISGTLDGAIFLIDIINWTILDQIHYDNEELGLIPELDIDANGDLLAIAQRPNDLPVILKYDVSGTTLSELGIRYFEDGETAFSSPNIYTDPSLNRLYYTDARKDHPESYGDFDILFGSFDLQLTDTCLLPITIPSISTGVVLTNQLATSNNYVLPIESNVIDLIPPGYGNQYVCPDSSGFCCQDSLGFIDAVDNGFIISATGSVVTVDNYLLNDCAEVWIDWGDGSWDQIFASALPFSHTYNGTGIYTICILVTETNDDGTLCWEREYCQETEPLPVVGCVPCDDPLDWVFEEQNGNLAPRDLVSFNGDLIAASGVGNLSGLVTGPVARFDGTSWIDMSPSGFTADFDQLLVHQSKLWAIVGIRVAGSITHYDLALWDAGTNDWILQNLIFDLPSFSTYGRLYTMESHSNGILIGGEFEEVGPSALSANNIVLWDNLTNTFTLFGAGVGGSVRAITEFNGSITIGGGFLSPQSHIAWWDGASWQGFANGINNYTTNPNSSGVYDFEELSGELIVSGRFPEALNAASAVAGTKDLAVWDPVSSSWTDLGGGITTANIYHQVDEVKLIGSNLYLAGFFNNIGGLTLTGVAIWNGTSFVDPNINQPLAAYTIECHGNEDNACDLWIGGEQFIGRLKCPPVSTVDLVINQDIRVYPNPVRHTLMIESLTDEQLSEIKVWDMLGRLIWQQSEDGTRESTIEMSDWTDGVYLIQIQTESGAGIIQRIIKQ